MSNANDRIGQAAEEAAREIYDDAQTDVMVGYCPGTEALRDTILRHLRPAVDAAVAEAVADAKQQIEVLEKGIRMIGEASARRKDLALSIAKQRNELAARVRELEGALDEVGIGLNDWRRERQAMLDKETPEYRRKQELSLAHCRDNPWVYAEETIRRRERELIEPVRRLQNLIDAALAPPAAGATEPKGRQMMINVMGKPFRCDCGCNVFSELEASRPHYKCNSCGANYLGEYAPAAGETKGGGE